ncbi:MAG: 4Fe-4S binding protein, partial [Oscillospiraceae bacterium]|nr:4Fe-4S binding protein [Oscillospiraceae bacterium]
SQQTWVACRSKENALGTRKNCTNGCLGCKKCERTCEFGAITVTENRAHIDPEKCTNCGKCAEACPTKCIRSLLA